MPNDLPATSVTIGTFDGVHAGHRVLLDRVVEDGERGLLPVAVTFDPHPLSVVRPELAPQLLTTVGHRVELLEQAGLGAVLVLPFTRERAHQEAAVFVRDVLVDTLHARHVVVGRNFRFGHRAAGDVALLVAMGAKLGFTVTVVELVPLLSDPAGAVVEGGTEEVCLSSTEIRAMVAAGDVEAAARALGRPHRVSGPVVTGDRRGRDLGFPTANLAVDPSLAIPADGVYAGHVRFSGNVERWWPAAVSVGSNPTFEGAARRVEAYAIDAPPQLDVYGQVADVDFEVWLRGMERFADVTALVHQMTRDVEAAREVLSRASTR